MDEKYFKIDLKRFLIIVILHNWLTFVSYLTKYLTK